DADEANVRTVPCRVNLAALPGSPTECNAEVTVTDPNFIQTPGGSLVVTNPIGFGIAATVNTTTSWDVSVDVNSGALGGEVCNVADLAGAACGGTLSVIVGY